jgi:hypothetical protein
MCLAVGTAQNASISLFFLMFQAVSAICTRWLDHHFAEKCVFEGSKKRGGKSLRETTTGANRGNK